MIGLVVYFWGYSEGEVGFYPLLPVSWLETDETQVVVATPWSLPPRSRSGKV
jgi:hypothetical protein